MIVRTVLQKFTGDQAHLSSRHIFSTNHNLSPVDSFNFIPLLSYSWEYPLPGYIGYVQRGTKISSTAYAEGTKSIGLGIGASIRMLTPCHQASCENFGRFKIGQSWISNPKSFQTQKRSLLVVSFPSLELWNLKNDLNWANFGLSDISFG